MLSAATALVTMAVLAGYGVVIGVDASLKPGKYCAYQDVFSPTPGMMLRGCMFFQYDSPGEAIVGYNYFGIHYYAFRYDSAVIKENTFILKRFGRSEGPEIYPYYEVGFDLKVSPGSAEVVQMVSKKGDYVHNLTMTACENPTKYDAACVAIPYAVSAPDGSLTSDEETPTGLYDNRIGPHDVSTYFRAKDSLARTSFRDWRSPLGQSSAIYNSGASPMKLSKARCGELIQLDNLYVNKTKQFVNVPAQWLYFSYDNTVEFVPNNKSKPSVVLIHLPKVSKK
ncbi:hypothetical protein Pmar_PMAR028292 [Perkinsus marinus ATCC 50983]|uniref:Uncharacterized protein n=1 Tax=Perkinsus marinus (strain ATCC 50983 / TXsc) TaxID=423536 RepID=C5LN43_PERM5|nr:hypothetical protein Pmar_PMAR028292 [Perkinsus marinus ATCC 50983]EER01842.1 hypothetical protein Pmar_PMAR028292 [Perkinsus marinus ATCC 50983]|eukprot:XP_002769124.1 hypothetical protein Pmar_PMAR028292 [Perkinsus marinus ATCC 50983]